MNVGTIIKKCYNIYLNEFNQRFNINDQSPVYDLLNKIKQLPEINDIDIIKKGIGRYTQIDGDDIQYKSYIIKIESIYGNLSGEIQCCPFEDKYDMILILNENINESTLNESLLLENFNIQKVIEELKLVKSFEELKQVAKKNIRGGILAGTLLSIILVNFVLNDQQDKELKTDIYGTELEQIKNEIQPMWKLITDNVEATVYNATKKQCNDDNKTTASGFELNMKSPEGHRIIAMERSMMKKYGLKYGDLVMIKGTDGRDGIYQIQDTMNKRFKGKNKIDILVNKDTTYGKWNDVKIYALTNPEVTYDKIKDNMDPAMNQDKIDSKQNHNFNFEK